MASPIIEPRPSIFVDIHTGALTPPAAKYMDLTLIPRIQSNSLIVASNALNLGASASIGTTVLVATTNAALYRISFYAQLVQAGSISSSLAASVISSYNSQTITQSLAAVTGNTLQTVLMGSILARCAAGGVISFTTTYADGGGGTPMKYDLYVEAEAL